MTLNDLIQLEVQSRRVAVENGGAAAHSSSPDGLRGVERNLPAVVARSALHPPVTLTVMNSQDGPKDGGIDRVPMVAGLDFPGL